MISLRWLHLFLRGWFWMAVDGFGYLQMVLGGFRWFSEIFSFSSYGEICCFKFKRNRQLWKVFVVSRNNDVKVPLKQMTKFLGNSKYNVSLKKTLGGWEKFKKTLRRWEKFFLMKIDIYIYIYIWLYVNSPGFDSVFPHFGAIFSRTSSFGLLLVGRLYSRLSVWQIFLFIETLL